MTKCSYFLLKSWIYLFIFFLILIIYLIIIDYKNIISVYVYLEIFWILYYAVVLISVIYTNSPLIMLLSFFVLVVAVLDVILFGLFLSIKIK